VPASGSGCGGGAWATAAGTVCVMGGGFPMAGLLTAPARAAGVVVAAAAPGASQSAVATEDADPPVAGVVAVDPWPAI
jgi:hypothetical protein